VPENPKTACMSFGSPLASKVRKEGKANCSFCLAMVANSLDLEGYTTERWRADIARVPCMRKGNDSPMRGSSVCQISVSWLLAMVKYTEVV